MAITLPSNERITTKRSRGAAERKMLVEPFNYMYHRKSKRSEVDSGRSKRQRTHFSGLIDENLLNCSQTTDDKLREHTPESATFVTKECQSPSSRKRKGLYGGCSPEQDLNVSNSSDIAVGELVDSQYSNFEQDHLEELQGPSSMETVMVDGDIYSIDGSVSPSSRWLWPGTISVTGIGTHKGRSSSDLCARVPPTGVAGAGAGASAKVVGSRPMEEEQEETQLQQDDRCNGCGTQAGADRSDLFLMQCSFCCRRFCSQQCVCCCEECGGIFCCRTCSTLNYSSSAFEKTVCLDCNAALRRG